MEGTDPMTACPINLTADQYQQIKQCEAVAVREYEREDGSRFAEAVGWGDRDELECQVSSYLFVIPAELKHIATTVVDVSELLPPEEDE